MKKIALGLCVLITLGTGSLFAISDPCRNEFGGNAFGGYMNSSGNQSYDNETCQMRCQYGSGGRSVTGNFTIINYDGATYCCCEKKKLR